MAKITSQSEGKPITKSYDHVVVNTFFDISELNDSSIMNEKDNSIIQTNKLIESIKPYLKEGGLLFIYGMPKHLPFYAEYLDRSSKENDNYLFKYWIALECSSNRTRNILKNRHLGLLMYLKTKSKKIPTAFKLNTKEFRIPTKVCRACSKNLKDWGGKKHLMNPLGTAYSDVWSDTALDLDSASTIPKKVVGQIDRLVPQDGTEILIINQKPLMRKDHKEEFDQTSSVISGREKNKVILADSIDYLKKLKRKYPGGVFDLAFADPPYNLSKNYGAYDDDQADIEYLNWCNEWLKRTYEVLKPGGALLVLNIPRWAVHHSSFLSGFMNFQHWIVWDALSTPAGKLLPAHYALLYFTKSGGKIKNNYEKLKQVESRKYCLRASCIKKRRLERNDEKETMSDVWKDVHRIKHKKDRDQHPCQLPLKLMNRIIELFTDKGDLVYDPFGGAGTTAISAKLLGRNYIITEIDQKYVNIARKNLSRVKMINAGSSEYLRDRVKQKNNIAIPKKTIEVAYIELCRERQKILGYEEIKNCDSSIRNLIDEYTGNFKKLQNVCKRKFEAESLLK